MDKERQISEFFADKANMECNVLALIEDFANKHGVSVGFTANITVESIKVNDVGNSNVAIKNRTASKRYKVDIE